MSDVRKIFIMLDLRSPLCFSMAVLSYPANLRLASMSTNHSEIVALYEAMVSDDGLDARLVVHVHDELLTARGSHHIRPGLVSSLASEEILHTKTMYPYIISRICNKCDLLNNIVRGRLTHSSCFTHSALLLNSLSSRSTALGATA
jgi:hypothetical protein